MLYRKKNTTTTTSEVRAVRHTIKLDDDMYYTLDQWKAWVRLKDPDNRLTVSDIVRHGLALALKELEAKYGQLPNRQANPEHGSDEG